MIKSRRLRWVGHVEGMEEGSAFKILIDTPAEKRPLGRPRRRMVLKEIGINTRN